MKNVKQFYKELGHLLYAIAMADKKVQKKELEALHQFVAKELAFFETSSDSSGMNEAFYTDFEFESYLNKKVNLTEAKNSFMHYLDANLLSIDPELIEKALKAIEVIGNAYRNINYQERILIQSIKDEVAQISDIF